MSAQTVKFFGAAHPRLEKADTPVGSNCHHCEEAIVDGDRGYIDSSSNPFHEECFMRLLFGSVGHQQKRCSCFGGTEEDPAGMTIRQAAKAAMDLTHEGKI